MKRYRVAISQVWTYDAEIEAENRQMADEIAGEMATEISPEVMTFGDDYVEVWEVK